jgi:Flp pilus assembly pilin Flp
VTPGDSGASLVEYALLLGLIVVVAVGAVILLGNHTANAVNNAANSFP